MRVFLAIMVVLLILLLIFAVQNPGSTQVKFLTFSSTVSLLLIIVVSAVLGLLLGLAVMLPGNLRRSSRVRKLGVREREAAHAVGRTDGRHRQESTAVGGPWFRPDQRGRRPTGPEPMRIAMLSPIAWRTPPRHYGPWEQVVSLLTEGLVRRGVDVTLFATGDSLTTARLQAVCPPGYEEDPTVDAKVWEALTYRRGLRAGRGVRPHPQPLRLPAADLLASGLDTGGGDHPRLLLRTHPARCTASTPTRSHYVAISDADRAPGLRYMATVYHGIDFAGFTLRPDPGEYLLFFGRIHPDKGAAEAIADRPAGGAEADHRRRDPGRGLLPRQGGALPGR